MAEDAAARRLDRLPRGVWLAAGSAVVLLMGVASRYGFHRDELYFVVAGRRLDWGYVDQPPLTPLVARFSELVGGTSPVAVRVVPALAVGAVAVMAATMARRFGGGRAAQVFAAFTAGWTGVLLGEGHLLSTAVFDHALWTAALLALVTILGGGDRRWWLALGLVVGIGLQNKHTMAFLAAGLLLGLLATSRRRLLGSWWPWLGVAIAAVVALPNVVWQAVNGWPQLEMAEALANRSDGPVAFVVQQPALLSVTLAVFAVAGLWRLARAEAMRVWRPIAVAYGALFVVFLVGGGKSYYIAPMYPALLAAGSLWFESLARGGRRVMVGAAAVGIVAGIFIALPLLPVRSAGAMDATGELVETVGWPDLVEQVEDLVASIPAEERGDAVVFTSSYGEAGALEVLGDDLPTVASGHNTYHLWGPPGPHGAIVGVGRVESVLRLVCPNVQHAGAITNRYTVVNESAGLPLWWCPQPHGQLADVWDVARHYE
jgi:4-amino-4-deoxy-L-arabinose transferase-like glycosyltransferase